MTYYVTRVSKSLSADNSHEHIVGVWTTANTYHSNADVIASINNGNVWLTQAAGAPFATIKPLPFCPTNGCFHKPYITTAPDHSRANNLENLPRV